MEDPQVIESRMDTIPVILVADPKIESCEPKRAEERSDIEDPRLVKDSTDAADPNRPKLLTLMDDPR
jgi:hypothetical protein